MTEEQKRIIEYLEGILILKGKQILFEYDENKIFHFIYINPKICLIDSERGIKKAKINCLKKKF